MNREHPDGARVLVSAGSKHGATEEIARRIATTLNENGCNVDHRAPAEISDLDGFDAVVLGSAVYAGHWTPDAKELAERIADTESKPRVFIFSSGPLGDPPKPDEEPVDVTEVMRLTDALEHHLFSGKIDKSKLSFGEKAIMIAVRAPEGDFRDWDAIDRWSQHIAEHLAMEVSKR